MKSNRTKKSFFSLPGLILVILFFFMLAGGQAIFAQTASTTLENNFRRANELYAAGNYAEAAGKYSELIKSSGASSELYYNLGCAYLKDGKPGYALSSFMKAAKLDPRDPDIRKNIEFVKAVTSPAEDGTEDGSSVLMQKIDEILFFFSDLEIGITQIALLVLLSLLVIPLITGQLPRFRGIVVGGTLTVLFLLIVNIVFLAAHVFENSFSGRAVIVQSQAEARSGPGEDNSRVLVIPEATVVRIREQRGDWTMISLPSGRSGWLPSKMVVRI